MMKRWTVVLASAAAVAGVTGLGLFLLGVFDGEDATAGVRLGPRSLPARPDVPRQISPPGGVVDLSADDLLAQLYGHDRILVELAQDIPGLAGMFIGSDGATLQVRVIDPASTRVADVKENISLAFPDDPQMELRDVELRQADYSFLELAQWYVPLRQRVLGQSGVVSTDIGERSNRLEIGVLNAETQAWVKERVKELSIPEAAVLVEVVPPIQNNDSTARGRRWPR